MEKLRTTKKSKTAAKGFKKAVCLALSAVIVLSMAAFYVSAQSETFVVAGGDGGERKRACAIYGNYLYTMEGDDSSSQIEIYDISFLQNIVKVTPDSSDLKSSTPRLTDGKGILCIDGGYLYAAFGSYLRKFSLADPKNPTLVQTFYNTVDGYAGYGAMTSFGDWLIASSNGRTAAYKLNEEGEETEQTRRFSTQSSPVCSDENYVYIAYRDAEGYDNVCAIDAAKYLPSTWKEDDICDNKTVLASVNGPEDYRLTYKNKMQIYGGYLYFSEGDNKKLYRINVSNGVYQNMPCEEIYGGEYGFSDFVCDGNMLYIHTGSKTEGILAYKITEEGLEQRETVSLSNAQNNICIRLNANNGYLYFSDNFNIVILPQPDVSDTSNLVHIDYRNLSDERQEDGVSMKLTVSNNGSTEKEAFLIQAVYDENGTLISVNTEKEKLLAGEEQKVFSFDILDNKTAAERDEASVVKYFAWESENQTLGLTPLSPASAVKFINNTAVSYLTAYIKIANILKIAPVYYQNAFDDVDENNWYGGYLQALVNNEVIEGGGNATVNLAICEREFVKLCISAKNAAIGGEKMTETEMAKVLFDVYSENYSMSNGKFLKALAAFENMLCEGGFSAESKNWGKKPEIYKLSDEVKPGESIQIYGESLYYIDKINVKNTVTQKNYKISPLQSDKEGHFVYAILPENAAGGVYSVSAENCFGKSNELLLNAPRPFWVAESDILMSGMTAKIVGTNLLPESFGASGNIRIKLKTGGKEYEANVTKQEPYKTEFTVPEFDAEGSVTVLLSNDGNTWVELENEQELKAHKAKLDPYELGVGWASAYNYTNVVNAKEKYSLKGNGTTNDRAVLEKAMKSISEAGGGVLYLPNGSYAVDYLTLFDNVIIAGESRENTKIIYTAGNNSKFIYNNTVSGQNGTQGIYNLTVTTADGTLDVADHRDFMIHIFEYAEGAKYENFFMKDVTVDMPLQSISNSDVYLNNKRMFYRADISKNFLVKNCSFKGAHAGFMPIAADYATVVDTRQEAIGSSLESTGCYALFENNNIILHNDYKDENDYGYYAQGLFTRSHFYAAKNSFKNLGTSYFDSTGMSNDGEIICSENPNGGTVKMAGKIESATLNTAKLLPLTYTDSEGNEKLQTYNDITSGENDLTAKFGSYYLEIIDGRGLGQYRRVTKMSEREVTLEKPWDIVPDESSKFLLTTMTAESIMYLNTANNAQKGFWLYGGVQDCIIANNVGVNVAGSHTVGFDVGHNYRRMPAYFVTVKNNSFTGYSKGRNNCCISCVAADETKTPLGYVFYGAVIKGNSMTGANQITKSWTEGGADPYASEAPNKNGIVIGNSEIYGATPRKVMKAAVIENNTLTDMTDGITVMGSGASGVLLIENKMLNVNSPYNTSTADNIKNLDAESGT